MQLFISLVSLPLVLLVSSSYAQQNSTDNGGAKGVYLCNWQNVELGRNFNVSDLNGTWYEIANTALAREADNNSCACSAALFTPQNVTTGADGSQQNLTQDEWEQTGNYTVDSLCYNTTNNSVVQTQLNAYFPLSPSVGAIAYTEQGTGEEVQELRNERELLYPGGAEDLILTVGTDNGTNNSPYVVLGSPCFLDARIYSRSPTMSNEAYQDARSILRSRGYPLSILGFLKVNQNETFCAPMADFISNLTQGGGNGGQGTGTTSPPPTLRRTLLFR